MSLGFYRDLAVGAAPDGAEAWSAQDTLMHGVSVGAPPDPFAAQGQIWCLPPPDPVAMRRDGYAAFNELLVANMRHAGALRIDHVMGLRRLFVIPDGASGADGAYVTYPLADLLAQVALESQRARCLVVGEDLGTVPEGMSETLAASNILSYSVLWFQRRDGRIRPPAEWRRLAAACVSTHDLPTLAGWWNGADIAEKRALSLLDDPGAEQARAGGKAELIALLRQEGLLTEDVDPAQPMPAGVRRRGPRVRRRHAGAAGAGAGRRPGRRDRRGQPAGHRQGTPELAPPPRSRRFGTVPDAARPRDPGCPGITLGPA